MRGLRRDTGTAIILITHDLGVVAEMADDVAVMYAGQIVERAPVRDAVRPAASIPTRSACSARSRGSTSKRERLPSIEGRVPDMTPAARGLPLRRALPVRRAGLPRRARRRWSRWRRAISTRCRRAPLAAGAAMSVVR